MRILDIVPTVRRSKTDQRCLAKLGRQGRAADCRASVALRS